MIDTVENYWEQSQLDDFVNRASKDARENFISCFSDYHNIENTKIELHSSGSNALETLLKKRNDDRTTVLVSAFTCNKVKNAIIKSGYKISTYDFSGMPGKIDWSEVSELIHDDISILIVTHLFGIPVDFSDIKADCEKSNVSIIEDCAHTLGGKIGNEIVGTIGDAAIFSFNYDKPISLCWGGISIVNNSGQFTRNVVSNYNLSTIEEELEQLRFHKKWLIKRIQGQKYSGTLIYRIYKNIFHRYWKNKLMPLETIGLIQSELGQWSLSNFDKIKKIRNSNAEYILSHYKGESWYMSPDIEPSFLKLKLGIKSNRKLENIINQFNENEIRAGVYNWPYIIEDKESSKHLIARMASQNWIDVPIHQNLSEKDLEKICKILSDI